MKPLPGHITILPNSMLLSPLNKRYLQALNDAFP